MTEDRELNPPLRILMGPGPSNVHPRVLRAMSTPLVGHLDPEFLKIMDEVQELLRYVFQTKNQFTIPVSGTGSAGMETGFVNLIEDGDEVVVGVNGVFGERMSDIVGRCGGKRTRVEAEWGNIIPPEKIAEAVKGKKVKLVAVVHAETSTGAWQPLEEIANIAHNAGALFLVDAVTSLGGCPVKLDEWGIDVCYSGTQKCLSAPPGLSPVSFNERARQVITSRKKKVQSWYLDMSMIEKYWGKERTYHHTAPITMVYGLREALRLIQEEGLENCFKRHELNHKALKKGLEKLGLSLHANEGHRLWMLNTVRVPEGIDEARVRKRLLDEFNIEIGGGLGVLKGKVWRVGLMGYSSREENVIYFLHAMEKILDREGWKK
ncbi:MAG: alanine--glyoxylate aminotransferase family protein [Candidatus Omnitrophica bacterium]|nr:alanine--glyoxylate aminotransferase family protein [Candidatus Omnitrophota bacterium]